MPDSKDPFHPETGEFAKNIRSIIDLDDTELEQSLKKFGWIEHLPAFKDENGVVIAGHRRLRLAERLHITPVIKVLQFGRGSEADAERLKLAIASNLGGKPMSAADRKHIAQYLYGKDEWTMQRIANALNVSQATITGDLRNLSATNKSKPAKTASNPKGAGRHKGSGAKAATSRTGSRINTHRAQSRPKVTDKHEDTIIALADSGKTTPEIAGVVGLHSRVVHRVIQDERIRREARAEPEIARADLSLSAQEKLDAAIRQHKRKLDLQFESRVVAEIRKRVDEIVLPHWKEQIAQAKTLYERRKGLMDKETFNIIRRALHPDSRNSISDKKLGEAFGNFMKLEKYLLNEADSQTEFGDLPKNAAEWDLMRMRAKAKRRYGVNPMARR